MITGCSVTLLAEIQPIHWIIINQNSRGRDKVIVVRTNASKRKSSRGRTRFNRCKPSTSSKPLPLQLGEEVGQSHGECSAVPDSDFFGAKIFWTSASKRGSLRSGSNGGNTFMSAIMISL